MTVARCGGARMVKLSTRFCFAPTSSSPSTSNTGDGPVTTIVSADTWPASLTSVTWAEPLASASSSVTYSASRVSLQIMGTTERFSNDTLSPECDGAKRVGNGGVVHFVCGFRKF